MTRFGDKPAEKFGHRWWISRIIDTRHNESRVWVHILFCPFCAAELREVQDRQMAVWLAEEQAARGASEATETEVSSSGQA
ncbi:MAG: hypothetical protein ACYCU5_14670 [Actinomycetes bacterium]